MNQSVNPAPDETDRPEAENEAAENEAAQSAGALEAGGEASGDRQFEASHQEAIEALIVDLDGYEGPLDVLLELARTQKVDIRKISMVALVDQYLQFINAAKRRDLELAADYLVMAAWLAFLKTKLLLPIGDEAAGEPTADEMAARLAFQLQRLEAMRNAVEALRERPQFRLDFFPRGAPEGVRITRRAEWQADLYELLRAYAGQRIAAVDRDYHVNPPKVYSIEQARARLSRILGAIPEWTNLLQVASVNGVDAPGSSLLASAFSAALEFAKDGKIILRQLAPFDPVFIKARPGGEERERQ